MYIINSYFTVALWLSVIGAIVLAILQWYNSAATESRMKRMMLSCGIDDETAADPDRLLHFDVDAARSRCRHCPVTHLCDRWLDGEAVASNSFCPNAWVFVKASAARAA